MTIGRLQQTQCPEGTALNGSLQIGGYDLPFVLVPSGNRNPRVPLFYAFAPCPCCGEIEEVGSAWSKRHRKGQGSFLLITLNGVIIKDLTTLYAEPDGSGGYAVSPRRARKSGTA
jgi:hypothetical protein